MNDLAKTEPDRLTKMIRMWEDWEQKIGVQPWPLPSTPKGEGGHEYDVPPYLKNPV